MYITFLILEDYYTVEQATNVGLLLIIYVDHKLKTASGLGSTLKTQFNLIGSPGINIDLIGCDCYYM